MQVGLRRPPFLSSLTFLNFEQTLYPGVSMMSISFSSYFVFLFLAETLCWYKDDEVGFKLKILEFVTGHVSGMK